LIATQYIYQGIQKISFFSILNVCKGILVTASVFLLVNNSGDYLIYAFITSFFSLSVNLFLLLYAYKKFNLRFKFYPLKDSLKSLKADKHLFFSSVVFNLYTSTNIIILGFYESTTVVGYYTVALGLIGIIQSVVNIPMSVALFPFVGSSFAESIDNGIEQLRRIFPLVFYVAFFGGIVLFFIAPFLVHLIYGKAFEASVISIKILCFLPLLSCLSSLFGTLTMINLKMDKEFFVITFIASVVSLCSNFIFVSFFSYIGTTISYLITEIVVIFGLYYSLKKRGVNLIKLEYFRLAEIVNLVKKIR
jgi:PST family polysaccharide transporter